MVGIDVKKRLKYNVFYQTFLRCFKNISKEMLGSNLFLTYFKILACMKLATFIKQVSGGNICMGILLFVIVYLQDDIKTTK